MLNVENGAWPSLSSKLQPALYPPLSRDFNQALPCSEFIDQLGIVSKQEWSFTTRGSFGARATATRALLGSRASPRSLKHIKERICSSTFSTPGSGRNCYVGTILVLRYSLLNLQGLDNWNNYGILQTDHYAMDDDRPLRVRKAGCDAALSVVPFGITPETRGTRFRQLHGFVVEIARPGGSFGSSVGGRMLGFSLHCEGPGKPSVFSSTLVNCFQGWRA